MYPIGYTWNRFGWRTDRFFSFFLDINLDAELSFTFVLIWTMSCRISLCVFYKNLLFWVLYWYLFSLFLELCLFIIRVFGLIASLALFAPFLPPRARPLIRAGIYPKFRFSFAAERLFRQSLMKWLRLREMRIGNTLDSCGPFIPALTSVKN